jgi:hypothetical protein
MNTGRTIFSQLMDFLPIQEFRKCVQRYRDNYKIQSFSCWDQFLCLAFAQLTYRENRRDIQVCLRAAQKKLYHMGIRSKVSRNTLVHANQFRDWGIYADFAQILIRTHAKVHDVNILDQIAFEPGAFYIMDRGYLDFGRLYTIHHCSAFFVTRARNSFHLNRRQVCIAKYHRS